MNEIFLFFNTDAFIFCTCAHDETGSHTHKTDTIQILKVEY